MTERGATLLVAATGGHLKQLHLLRNRLWGVSPPYRWVTFDRPQSRSMLEGEDVEWVDFIGTRDPVGAISGLGAARRIVKTPEITAVVSTGSAIALPYLATARARGLKAMYIESAARCEGPSLTGQLAGLIPGVERYTQYPSWADGQWSYRGAAVDSYAPGAIGAPPPLRSVVVTLGTMTYPFPALLRRLLEILPPDVEVLWQTGATPTAALGIDGVAAMAERALMGAMSRSDVVVAHAGVGSAFTALDSGRVPVLVPRRAQRNEHVDDHQEMIAGELQRRGLALAVEVDDLRLEHLLDAAARSVRVVPENNGVTQR